MPVDESIDIQRVLKDTGENVEERSLNTVVPIVLTEHIGIIHSNDICWENINLFIRFHDDTLYMFLNRFEVENKEKLQ